MVKLICIPLTIAAMVAQASFTAGAVAGTAGVIGLLALRRRLGEAKSRSPT